MTGDDIGEILGNDDVGRGAALAYGLCLRKGRDGMSIALGEREAGALRFKNSRETTGGDIMKDKVTEDTFHLPQHLIGIIESLLCDDQPSMTRDEALAYIVYDWGIGMCFVEGPPEETN
jgi:hypothetical protein